MRVRILPSAPGSPSTHQYLTTFLIDDRIAIDAGCLGLHSASPDAPSPASIFITHPHVDHIGTLPIFLENGRNHEDRPVRIYGSSRTLAALRHHLFNNHVWVSYSLLRDRKPRLDMHPIRPERTVVVGNVRITGVPVHHAPGTLGYVVEDDSSTVVFGADSGPTERIWEIARERGRWRAAFLECSFPDRLESLAAASGHLTPRLCALEAQKIPPDVEIVLVHIKPSHREDVIGELAALDDPRLLIGEIGREYRW